MLNRRIMRFAPAWLAANAVLGAWFSVGPFLAAGAPNRSQFLMRGFSAGEISTAYLVFGILFTVGAIAWGFVMPTIGRQATLLGGVAGLGFTSVALWALNHVEFDATHSLVPILVGAGHARRVRRERLHPRRAGVSGRNRRGARRRPRLGDGRVLGAAGGRPAAGRRAGRARSPTPRWASTA